MKKNKLKLLFLTISMLIKYTGNAQSKDLVKSDGILNELHGNHIGRITFMNTVIPIENYSEKDFLNRYELKKKGDLNIRVFMENSLTNYLHPLAPTLTAEEVNKIGNYQFSFYIDSILIYKENLVTGAGNSESKKTKTIFRIPFISSSNEDSWGRFMWNRFLSNGGDEVLSDGIHNLSIEIRPYININEVKTGKLIAKGSINLIINKPKVNRKKIRIQSIKKQKDFQISNASFDRNKIVELKTKIAEKQFKDITSIIIIKENELLLKEYFNGANRKTLHDTRSVGKTFASALLGIAIDKGYIKSETERLDAFYNLSNYKNNNPLKSEINLKQLLTMSSSFKGSDENADSPGNEENMYPTDNWVKFALDLPIDNDKKNGEQWEYFTAGVVVLGDIVHNTVPEGLEKFAKKNLFEPLNIKHYKWGYTPQKVANTAGGLRMSSLDFAKFGQLYLNKGMYKGQNIISENWIAKSLSKQIALTGQEGNYGYLFWQKDYIVNEQKHEAYLCNGNGGNKIIIFKALDLVMVITTNAFNMPYAHTQIDKIIAQYLIPAILN